MHTPIAEDFAAIRARLLAIRNAERAWLTPQPLPEPAPAAPGDFYAWLMGGGLWATG
ncbi:hypothetical protein ACFQS7_21560 [Dankookia sp. GCM10030260]|uniref:hypothetical protein n=1 Tax=Dankookia sp. GCM10030260 TaxID=3273390 RepID=UPI00360AF0BC